MEHQTEDGKWHGTFGMPFGAKTTGKSRTIGYRFDNGSPNRYESPEEARQKWKEAIDRQKSQFRQTLEDMTPKMLEEQRVFWKKQYDQNKRLGKI